MLEAEAEDATMEIKTRLAALAEGVLEKHSHQRLMQLIMAEAAVQEVYPL
jgi:hypothetical protein